MYQGKTFDITFQAGADLRNLQYRVIGVDGDLAANPAEAIGVLQTKPNSGEHGAAAWLGEMKAVAGAAVNSGSLVTVAASGFLVAYSAVSSGAYGLAAVGKALASCSSGDVFPFLGNFANAGTV